MTLRIALFTLASDVFREQADKDYIAARACYRMNLREQFLWSALQACEKYLKGTLLFNERGARYAPQKYATKKNQKPQFGHNLEWLFEAVQGIGDLPLDKPVWLPGFLKYLNTFGNNRYLSKSTYATGFELRELDEAVWVLRIVCQNFDWIPDRSGNPSMNLRPNLLAQISDPKNRKNPALHRPLSVITGFLEKKLDARSTDPARQALVWKNMFFGKRQRHAVSYTRFSSSENPPQASEWFTPALRQSVEDFIKLD